MHKIKAIANDYERKLVGEFGFFQKVFHALRIEAIRFAANALDFFYLSGLACGLYVLEMNIGLLTKVDYGAEEIK